MLGCFSLQAYIITGIKYAIYIGNIIRQAHIYMYVYVLY